MKSCANAGQRQLLQRVGRAREIVAVKCQQEAMNDYERGRKLVPDIFSARLRRVAQSVWLGKNTLAV